MNRRDFLFRSGGGFGTMRLPPCLVTTCSLTRPQNAPTADCTTNRKPRVVQLLMAARASHIDLFDFKPELVKRHGQEANFGEHVEAFQNGLGPWLKPIWEFKAYGKSGKQLS